MVYLFVIDMRAETSSCNELIEKTANALSDDTLRLLFVSVQKNNIYLSVRYAVAWSVDVHCKQESSIINFR
jgi:hypothetical protein